MVMMLKSRGNANRNSDVEKPKDIDVQSCMKGEPYDSVSWSASFGLNYQGQWVSDPSVK